jgi:hypothetical protein
MCQKKNLNMMNLIFKEKMRYIYNLVLLLAMDPDKHKKLVSEIHVLSQVEIEEIFRIIHESKCDYTKNNNGIFINLARLPADILEQIEKYVRFCNASKQELTKYESLCDVLNHKMSDVTSDDTASTTGNIHVLSSEETSEEKMNGSKISPSMRYYLLKKRYSKHQGLPTTQINSLSKDE